MEYMGTNYRVIRNYTLMPDHLSLVPRNLRAYAKELGKEFPITTTDTDILNIWSEFTRCNMEDEDMINALARGAVAMAVAPGGVIYGVNKEDKIIDI